MEMTSEILAFIKEHDAAEKAQMLENFRRLNKMAKKGQILFTGSSLMEQFPVAELAMNHDLGKCIYNRGVGGFRTEDMINNMDEMLLGLEPKYVFINIGTNDICFYPDGARWQDVLKKNYDYILGQLKEKRPETVAYVMAYYPMDESDEEGLQIAQAFGSIRTNELIKEASAIAKSLAAKYGYHFIDVNEGLTDENGNLNPKFCKDNIHFYADGYEIVYKNLGKYLVNLT